MKKMILFFCCYVAAMSVASAQHEPVNLPGSAAFVKHVESVVRDAPFIFKGVEIKENAVRGKGNEVIAVFQLYVMEVIKGNIAVGDTVEFSYSLGDGIWNKNDLVEMPQHGYQPNVSWGNSNEPTYYFCKESNPNLYFKNTKQSFNLQSKYPFSLGTSNGRWFSALTFKTEYHFLNYINKILAPKEIITPKPEPQKIKSKKKQGKGDNDTGMIEYMPAKTLNIHVTDSTDNLDAYNSDQTGWYRLS